VTIQDIMFSEEDWGNFWVYFRGEPQQLDGIELLRKAIADADPALLTDSAEWVQKYRERPSTKDGFTFAKPFGYHVTEHITYGELCKYQEIRRFTHQHQCETAIKLCQFLEQVRSHFGGNPVIITSGHRPEPLNSQLGGATNSEHTYSVPGKGAVDFLIDGVSIKAVQDYCDKHWPHSVGYGAPRGFVHLGMRPNGGRIRWNY
jgi:hypothetical protein